MNTSSQTLAAKRRELARRLAAQRGLTTTSSEHTIPVRPDTPTTPLSYAQRRMWFLQHLDPHGAAYNLAGAVRLHGHLHTGALREAFTRVAAQHTILRTSYHLTDDGEPVQSIASEPLIDMTLHAIEDLPANDRDRRVRDTAERLAREPFDLTRPSALRIALLAAAPDHHVLVVVVHHIAFDDLSWPVFLRDLAAHYAAAQQEQPAPLRELPLQYADYAWWQRSTAGSEQLTRHRQYWEKQLTPPPATLTLPLDHARQQTTSAAGQRRTISLTPALSHAIKDICRRTGTTLFMGLLTGVQALLARYSGQNDITVGSPAVNRDQPGLDQLIGNFGNTLVLRTDVGGDPSFTGLLQRVRDVCTSAYAHQDYPFELLVEELRPTRAMNRSAFFDVLFSLRQDPLPALQAAGLTFTGVDIDNGTARFDLAIEAMDTPSGIQLTATYRTSLFNPATIDRLLGHLHTLLSDATANPDRPVSHVTMLTPSEEHTILHDWSHTSEAPVPPQSIAQLLHEQAQHHGDNVAVIDGDQKFTYAQLDANASRLAQLLHSAGTTGTDVIGVHLHRGHLLVTAILAVLKTGATFVPLDPALPVRRLQHLIEDSTPAMILTSTDLHPSGLDGSFGETPHIILDVPATLAGPAAPHDSLPPRPAGPDDPATYLMYTSGSTGRPKGVVVGEHALVNRLCWQQRLLGLGPGDTVLLKSPLSFDVFIVELLLPLLTGARLAVAAPGQHADPAALLNVIEEHQVSLAYFIPSLLDLLIDQASFATRAGSLRHVWCGGERLPEHVYHRFRAATDAVLHHTYGPTEAAVSVTCRSYGPDDRDVPISMGRPIDNTQVYLLDEYLQPVPQGVPGHLHIAGAALAHGYHHDEPLTSQRFITAPVGGHPTRLYRTGDLARWLPDGQVQFIGRIDNQIKIRGQRVEIEEIETVLAEHPAITRAALAIQQHDGRIDLLAAYCIPAPGDPTHRPRTAHLRDWLRTQLPEHMVPTAVYYVDALPETGSGKLDRAALTPPADTGAEPDPTPDAAPQDDLQRLIAAIWAHVLGIDQVGIHSNFFDLGGHSLLLARVQRQIDTQLHRSVPLVDLFAHPTVASLAIYLGSTGTGRPDMTGVRRAASRQRQALARRTTTSTKKGEVNDG